MRSVLRKLDYKIPGHALNPGYALGGLSAFLFLVLLVTGVALAFQFEPVTDRAYASVSSLINSGWGAVMRSLHAWSAEAFLVLIFLHITRVVLSKSFLDERRWTWFVGLVLLGLAAGAFFTGTVVKWDQEGYEAFEHQQAVLEMVPGGAVLGSFFTGHLLVSRLFIIHTVALPLLVIFFIILHFLFIKVLKISPKVPGTDDEETVYFSAHLRRLLGWGLAILGLLLFAASVWEPAHLIAPRPGVEWTKPPWPFYGLYFLENTFGLTALLWGPLGLFFGLAVLPFLAKKRPGADLSTWVFLVGLVLYLGVSLYVTLISPVPHLS